MKSVLFSCLLLVLAILGCGRRGTIGETGRETAGGGYYDTAWVDPQIIISDSLFTLIRAERIDSFYVSSRAYPVSAGVTSLTFHIDQQTCPTTVNLVNAAGEVVRPLVVSNLSRGYYKLSLSVSLFRPENHRDTGFYLKADYCGSSATESIRPTNKSIP